MKELPFKMIVETDIEKYRHDTFWTKEPELLSWIDSFELDDVFFDVGANIGLYSLYAASRGCEVVAFEPHPHNCERLRENMTLNRFRFTVGYYLAITDTDSPRYVNLHVPNQETGSSGAQILEPIDEHGERFKAMAVWQTEQTTLDIISRLRGVAPTHIKIDVDGHEGDVINGMVGCLMSKELKSILVECNDNSLRLIDLMAYYGFTTDNPFNSHPNHSRIRRKKEGIKAENLIFTRRDK